MDDMIYCSNNCGVARCLHHPSQIDNPETPHQFAHLHHTDYCPLWRQEVEKVEVVRCRDCKYQDERYRRISVKWLPCMEIRTEGNWFCASAERRGE